MIEKLIELLNLNDWYDGDEFVQIAKGKYSLPTNLKDLTKMAFRHIKK